MIEEKCKICGQEHKMLYGVTDKYGYYYKVCEMCYNARMSDADRLLKLEAKIEGIMHALSSCQRNEADSIARARIEKEVFNDLGDMY